MSECSVDGCPKLSEKKGLCGMHYRRRRLYGDVGPSEPTRKPRERDNYGAVHLRLRKARGPARAHPCSAEGCDRAAAEWSYDRADPAELSGVHRGADRVWSVDLSHYRPLCRSHHRSFDWSFHR